MPRMEDAVVALDFVPEAVLGLALGRDVDVLVIVGACITELLVGPDGVYDNCRSEMLWA